MFFMITSQPQPKLVFLLTMYRATYWNIYVTCFLLDVGKTWNTFVPAQLKTINNTSRNLLETVTICCHNVTTEISETTTQFRKSTYQNAAKKAWVEVVKLSCECPMWTQGLQFVITYTGKPEYYLQGRQSKVGKGSAAFVAQLVESLGNTTATSAKTCSTKHD